MSRNESEHYFAPMENLSFTVTMAGEGCALNLLISCLMSVEDMHSRCWMSEEDFNIIRRMLNKMELLLRALRNGGLHRLNELCEIRNRIYEAEDINEEIVCVGVKLQEQRGWHTWLDRLGFKWKLGCFSRMIQFINCRLESELLPDVKPRSLLSQPVRLPGEARQPLLWKHEEDPVLVGMEDATDQICRSLLEEGSKELKVVSIVGMGGMGKTTLARKIYGCDSVRHGFDCFGWASVGRNFRIRWVLVDLLADIGQKTREDMSSDSDLNLAEELFEMLKRRRYLIVLDDIWSVDDWECINIAFPCSESTSSRVILTTRILPVALATKGYVHEMSGLDEEQSLTLLSATAFRTQLQDTEEIARICRDIARKCSGLPLLVKVVGGLLASGKPLEMVLNSLVSYEGKPGSVLNLAYADLPASLKLMFLYFGIFQRGEVIDAERLYLLWSAEGFLSHSHHSLSMLDVAEGCLYQLWIRNLVQVKKQEVPTGRCFESCQLHDLIYDMCLTKQSESYFCVDLSFGRSNDIKENLSSLPHPIPKIRRISSFVEVGYHEIQSTDVNDWQASANMLDLSRLRGLYASNYQTFSEVKRDIPPNCLQAADLPEILLNLSSCESLTVLYCNCFRFDETSLPARILKLTRLRYLSLRNCHIKSVPSTICSLANLETLDIQECAATKITLPSDIQKLTSLKYLYLPYDFEVQGGVKLRLSTLVNLEILVNFDAAVCELKDLCKLTRLKKLTASIGGELEEVADMRHCMETTLNTVRFISLKLRKLGNCSTNYHVVILELNFNVLEMEGHLGKLPLDISVSLSELSLSGSELKEDPLEKLEKLPNLLILTLQHNAFLGKCMKCSVSGMPQLVCLALLNLDNLESLIVIEGGMPNLSTLTIDRCQRLRDLPETLYYHKKLVQLKVLHMPPEFVDHASSMRQVG